MGRTSTTSLCPSKLKTAWHCLLWARICFKIVPNSRHSPHSDTKDNYGQHGQHKLEVKLVIWLHPKQIVGTFNRCYHSGADPGFFLGGGALISCSTSTPINHIVFFFFCRIPVVLEIRRSSQGGVRTPCTLPLDPPLSFMLIIVSVPVSESRQWQTLLLAWRKHDESLT